MTPGEKDIRAKEGCGAGGAAEKITPETCGLQLECPVCGWKAEGVRCVRCGALKVSECGGSCGGCAGCG